MEDFKVVCIAVSERRSATKRHKLKPASMGMRLSSDTEVETGLCRGEPWECVHSIRETLSVAFPCYIWVEISCFWILDMLFEIEFT